MTAIAPDNLTDALKAILDRLTRIEEGQQKLAVEVANLQGRVSQLPTTWQMFTAIVGIVFATLAGTAGVLFAALNYARAL